MELFAFVTGAFNAAVIVGMVRSGADAQYRNLFVSVAGVGLAACILGLLVLAMPTFYAEDVAAWAGSLAGAGVWVLYVVLGVLMLLGVVWALRSTGSTRFAWRRGTYAQYTIREEYNERK